MECPFLAEFCLKRTGARGPKAAARFPPKRTLNRQLVELFAAFHAGLWRHSCGLGVVLNFDGAYYCGKRSNVVLGR